jgi:hypothetical protein
MTQPQFEDRGRERDIEINKKHGHTPVTILRRIYGQSFALGFDASTTLKDLLGAPDSKALSQRHRTPLYDDYDSGVLDFQIQRQLAE